MTDVSIVMCAYNAEKYIRECIDSVLAQTKSDFEFIIVDDGSTDGTQGIIESYDDRRISIISRAHNYIASLNAGMEAAKGKYIARMDSDDIMHPERIMIQSSILEAEPDIDMCSCLAQPFSEGVCKNLVSISESGIIKEPLNKLLLGNFIHHPGVMLRKDFWDDNLFRYPDGYQYAEDYKLWVDMASKGLSIYITPQVLQYYRIHPNQASQENERKLNFSIKKIRKEIISILAEKTAHKELIKEIANHMERLDLIAQYPPRFVSQFYYNLLRNPNLYTIPHQKNDLLQLN